MNSIQFHAGIGLGEWSTVIDDKDTFYQDGSAYHRARRSIDLAKKEKEYTAVICSETNRDCILNAMLNSCIQLIARSMTSTSFQKDLIVLLECCYPIQSSIHIDLSELEKLPAVVGSYHSYNDIRNDSLAEENTSYIHGTSKKSGNLLKDVKAINPVSTETCISGSKLVFQEAHPYGAAKRLAEITGSTRQNVDKTLYRTNVYAERAISLALISELGKLRSDDLFAGEAEK